MQTADRRSVGATRGLAPSPPVRGVFVIYSAGRDQAALDRLGPGDRHPNSVFTRVFIEKLKTPGLDLRSVTIQTRSNVVEMAQKIGHDQFPAYYDQVIGGDVYLAGPPQPGSGGVPGGGVSSGLAIDPCGAAAVHWQSVQSLGTLDAFEDHLRRFPTCAFSGLAAQEIKKLKTKVAVGVFSPSRLAAVLTAAEERSLKTKDSFKECNNCPEMVVVPAGSFTMGSPASEVDRDSDEGPQHRVTLARPFAVGKFAVTFDEWDACVADGGCNGHRPNDHGWGRGLRPAIDVNWHDAQAYVAWVARKTGKQYRLLSESEREYVTRAGTTTPFWWGSSSSTGQANYDGNSTYGGGQKGEYRKRTVPVDWFQPNPWGLYQVHGNVWEWTEDCWNGNYNGAPIDGSAWSSGDCKLRVLRGGSWYNIPRNLRSVSRLRYSTVVRLNYIGFRVARTLH